MSKPPDEKIDAYADGADAFYAGKSDTANPFDPATDEHLDWNDGWINAKESLEEGDNME